MASGVMVSWTFLPAANLIVTCLSRALDIGGRVGTHMEGGGNVVWACRTEVKTATTSAVPGRVFLGTGGGGRQVLGCTWQHQ